MAKVTLYNASENKKALIIDGVRTIVLPSRSVSIEKEEAKKFEWLVPEKALHKIQDERDAKRSKNGKVSVGGDEKIKTLEAQVAELTAQIEKLTSK